MKWTDKIEVTNEDNMVLMARYPDNYFDLAIVDPPYGIGAGKMQLGTGKKRQFKQNKNWDSKTPQQNYFDELKRISKNQIIWGGNYFTEFLKPSRCWIFWDKMTDGFSESYASGELAYCSFDGLLKQFTYKQQGNYVGFENNITTISSNANLKKIHPTQKPVALYKWLLDKYAQQGDKILDTHLGSGSIAIACHELRFELTACELDAEYYEAAHKRFQQQTAQLRLNLA